MSGLAPKAHACAICLAYPCLQQAGAFGGKALYVFVAFLSPTCPAMPAAGRLYGSVFWNPALRTESKKREMPKNGKGRGYNHVL
ncbi:MAG: hypothetical protein HY088_05435 [Ignavibacteriales bacterium]|nr:hypothetical protein [Ignavibacteriales bacterium]